MRYCRLIFIAFLVSSELPTHTIARVVVIYYLRHILVLKPLSPFTPMRSTIDGNNKNTTTYTKYICGYIWSNRTACFYAVWRNFKIEISKKKKNWNDASVLHHRHRWLLSFIHDVRSSCYHAICFITVSKTPVTLPDRARVSGIGAGDT